MHVALRIGARPTPTLNQNGVNALVGERSRWVDRPAAMTSICARRYNRRGIGNPVST
jgi:hypothetical protein